MPKPGPRDANRHMPLLFLLAAARRPRSDGRHSSSRASSNGSFHMRKTEQPQADETSLPSRRMYENSSTLPSGGWKQPPRLQIPLETVAARPASVGRTTAQTGDGPRRGRCPAVWSRRPCRLRSVRRSCAHRAHAASPIAFGARASQFQRPPGRLADLQPMRCESAYSSSRNDVCRARASSPAVSNSRS